MPSLGSAREPGQTALSQGSTHGQECDVFICHRGPDGKRDIVGHIKERLERANLIVFVDYELRKGGVHSWPEILATLRGARRVLVLLSPRFEESPWCLEEARAAAARPDAVLPVLFDREASWDAKKLRAAFRTFSGDCDFHHLLAEEPGLLADDMVERWHKALISVASISYEHFSPKFR